MHKEFRFHISDSPLHLDITFIGVITNKLTYLNVEMNVIRLLYDFIIDTLHDSDR